VQDYYHLDIIDRKLSCYLERLQLVQHTSLINLGLIHQTQTNSIYSNKLRTLRCNVWNIIVNVIAGLWAINLVSDETKRYKLQFQHLRLL